MGDAGESYWHHESGVQRNSERHTKKAAGPRMKSKQVSSDSYYGRGKVVTPYSDTVAPEPFPMPKGLKLDHEPQYMSDGEELSLPSPAEVILQKYIKPGFIHDFVMAMRGTETTTLHSIWGALFAVSGVLQRRSWLDWVIERLYPNLYLVFIARPGVCKKTVSISFGARVIARVADVFTREDDKQIYTIPTWSGSTTPEYLMDILKPRIIHITGDALGFDRDYPVGSRVAIIADELSEFLGKQKYNQGMISRLTKLYDCPREAKIGTKKDKTQEVRDVFVNFCGGTTPDGFRDSIPAEAHGGGLMSRCIIVWQEHKTRHFYRPKRIPGIPDEDELARRLAWIAEHRMGEYRLTEAADALYQNWYDENKSDLSRISDSDTRADILLVKTAHLIAASHYKKTQFIDEDDIQAAIDLVALATEQKHRAETELMVDSLWSENMQLVSKRLKKSGTMNRADLARAVSYKINVDELNRVLTALAQSNHVFISLDDQPKSAPGQATRELYTWNFADGR